MVSVWFEPEVILVASRASNADLERKWATVGACLPPLSSSVCLSVCVYKGARPRRVQEQVHRNRVETETMKANNSSVEGKDERRRREQWRGKRTENCLPSRAIHLTSFREFQECCVWGHRFGFDEFDYLVSVVLGDATARQMAIMVPAVLLETEAKVIDLYQYLSPHRVQAPCEL